MISQAIINLGIVGATFVILLIYLIRFVLRYKHQYESNPLCTSTVVFCLLIVLLVTFILPVDIFLVSFVKEPDGSFKQWATNETLATIDKSVFAAYYSKYTENPYKTISLMLLSLTINTPPHFSIVWYHHISHFCGYSVLTFLQRRV